MNQLISGATAHSESVNPMEKHLDGVVDYLSGMTDRYTIQEHHRLLGLKL